MATRREPNYNSLQTLKLICNANSTHRLSKELDYKQQKLKQIKMKPKLSIQRLNSRTLLKQGDSQHTTQAKYELKTQLLSEIEPKTQ